MATAGSHTPALLPTAVGIGLRAAHTSAILAGTPNLDWLEIHSENYFVADAQHSDLLRRLRERYPVSAHGVGASLGSADGLDAQHCAALATLVGWLQPTLVSEHLAWGAVDGVHSNDLLPLPYTEETLAVLCTTVDRLQTYLGRSILVENISSYVEYQASDIPEWEFMATLAARSGCGLLLDVNNLDVNARNHGLDARRYIDALPARVVREIHLAGHSVQQFGAHSFTVDTHDHVVAPSTWALYEHALRRFGPVPTLIEWDSALPPLAVLEDEVARARSVMDEVLRHAA